jgi:hypothetical protein
VLQPAWEFRAERSQETKPFPSHLTAQDSVASSEIVDVLCLGMSWKRRLFFLKEISFDDGKERRINSIFSRKNLGRQFARMLVISVYFRPIPPK